MFYFWEFIDVFKSQSFPQGNSNFQIKWYYTHGKVIITVFLVVFGYEILCCYDNFMWKSNKYSSDKSYLNFK